MYDSTKFCVLLSSFVFGSASNCSCCHFYTQYIGQLCVVHAIHDDRSAVVRYSNARVFHLNLDTLVKVSTVFDAYKGYRLSLCIYTSQHCTVVLVG